MTSSPRRSRAESGPAIAVRGLTKIFPVPFHRQTIVAVKDLNLCIEPGEVYGLLGPNGSGKSTTLKIILGLVSPTRGRTEIFGQDSRLVQSREAVGFLPENPYFQKFLTGEETLRFFGRLCGLRGGKTKESGERIARPRRSKQGAQPPTEDLFQRYVATHWPRASIGS
jgi:ABC-type multidrug transport system, ATPase component